MYGSVREDPGLRDVTLLAVGVAGLAMCITLLFQGMRAVMDVGGACGEGGPYVIATPCPDAIPATMTLGMLGLFGFGALGMVYGARVGGYGALPLLAWTGLFASLGWNFLDYGLLNPPPGEGVVWGWLVPGVMFQAMAWVPLVFVAIGWREARRTIRRVPPSVMANVLRGTGRPSRASGTGSPPPPEPSPEREVRDSLRDIATLMGATVAEAAAGSPADAGRRTATVGEIVSAPSTVGTGAEGSEFSEGTQALLDRLERLADMRDRGLLEPEEYETAKEAVMRELQARE